MPTLYKFLRERDGKLRSEHGDTVWRIGAWQEIAEEPELCERGYHGSERIIDALSYVQGGIIAQVEVDGAHVLGADKQCWQRMRVVQAWQWTKEDSVALAIYAAEQVITLYEAQYPDDTRPRAAIEAAKAYLAHPTDAAADAARAAARAADAAAYAARAAAYAAAYAARAADAAADAAAYAAAYAAENTLQTIETWLLTRLATLLPYTEVRS